MFGLGTQELLVILVIVLILFGANRLPQIARSLGSNVRVVGPDPLDLVHEPFGPGTPVPSEGVQRSEANPSREP